MKGKILWNNVTHQYNELYKTFTTHQHTNSKAFPPYHLAQTSCNGPTNEFANKGNDNDSYHICPGDATIKETNVSAQT